MVATVPVVHGRGRRTVGSSKASRRRRDWCWSAAIPRPQVPAATVPEHRVDWRSRMDVRSSTGDPSTLRGSKEFHLAYHPSLKSAEGLDPGRLTGRVWQGALGGTWPTTPPRTTSVRSGTLTERGEVVMTADPSPAGAMDNAGFRGHDAGTIKAGESDRCRSDGYWHSDACSG